MKPKNKFHQRVFDLSQTLPKITDTQAKRAYRHCLEHIGRRTAKGVITCTECGHIWQSSGALADTLTTCRCPNCHTSLKVLTTRKSKFNESQYFCIITACREFQVLRFIYVERWAKAGQEATYFHHEVVQRWIAPDGRYASIARIRSMNCWIEGWNWTSALEIRPENRIYNINPTRIHPRPKLMPELKQRGYRGTFGNLTPFDLMRTLLANPQAETLLKAGQKDLLHFFIHHSRDLNHYWPSIRIAIRNGYRISNPADWVDYIDLLHFFGRDLHNPHYVCPADLTTEHDRYVAKKQVFLEKERLQRQRQQALEDEQRFRELKARFFGIAFTDGEINVRVLESVEEIMAEGERMHHCVFTNNYHLRPDSLILSASINDQHLETIEFSLSRLTILQSRGLCNQTTPYHRRIVELVNRNISVIQKRTAA